MKSSPSPKPPPISALVYAKNEEALLPHLLEDLAGCVDEVLVLDGRSTDSTREIAKKMGARVMVRDEAGRSSEYSTNRYMKWTRHDWILGIDADERLSPELKAALPKLIQNPNVSAYRFARKNFLHPGRWSRHGVFYPDFQLRLYDRRRTRFPKAVHAFPIVQGAVVDTHLHILHFKYLRPPARDAAQRKEWAAGEQEEKNPLVRAGLFIGLLPYLFVREYLFQQGFREPGYLQLVWLRADYFSKHPHHAKERLRALMRAQPRGREKD